MGVLFFLYPAAAARPHHMNSVSHSLPVLASVRPLPPYNALRPASKAIPQPARAMTAPLVRALTPQITFTLIQNEEKTSPVFSF